MLKTARLRRDFFPYKYRDKGVDLELTRVVFDNDESWDQIDTQRRLIAIDGYKDWETARVQGKVSINDGVLKDVLPPNEREKPPIAISIALRCSETYLRQNFCEGSFEVGEKIDFEIPVERSDVRNTVDIVAGLVRTAEADHIVEDGYAAFNGAVLSDCRKWEIRVDPPELPAGKFLDIRYKSFKEKQKLFKLESDFENPILWLNGDYTDIARILNSKATRGMEARIRDVFFDMISHQVWTQLLLRAGQDITEDEEVRYEWEHAVLNELLTILFPDAEEQEAMLEFRDFVHKNDVPSLIEMVDDVVQAKLDLPKQMTALITEALRQ